MAYRATLDLGHAAWLHRASSPRAMDAPAPPHTVAVLRFALPRAIQATVLVHDAQGQVTRTLLTGELPAGEHACGWDGRDEQHVLAPAGEYSLRLEVASRLVTARRISIA
jgi:hypothetical protein